MFKRLGLLIVLLAVLIGVALGYWQVINSPEYALVDLAKGLEAQNVDWVDKRVDMDAVVGTLADQIVADELSRLNASPDTNGMLGMLAKGMGAGMASLMKPAIVAAANQQIKQGITDIKLTPRVKDLGNKATMLIIFRQVGDVKLVTTQTQANTATMRLEANKSPVLLTWKNTGPAGWEVVRLDIPPTLIKYWMSENARTHTTLPSGDKPTQ